MAVVYANIGSNLGDRKVLIEKALTLIGDTFGYYCISNFFESEPWGFDSKNLFMNIGVAFQSEKEPEEILDLLQAIEKEISQVAHRDVEGNYKDREIDIDILAIDNIRYRSSRLILPHPYLLARSFFLLPLYELLP